MQTRELPTTPNRVKQINKEFKGKTIKKVEILGVNSWKFHFADGTDVTIDTYAMGFGIYGPDIL